VDREKGVEMFGARADKRLIFVHVPRTGGTTMRMEVLYKVVDRRAIYCIDGHEPPTRGGSVEELLALPRKELEKLRVIVGHMPFGLRERLPWPETWHYVITLRDPVARTVSSYYQLRSNPQHHFHAEAIGYSLEESVRRRRWPSLDGMCQHLSNARYRRKFPSPEAMFQEALRNAEACALVGITEFYDETVRRLCGRFGWRVPRYEPRYSLTPKDRTLSGSELELLRESNVYDQRLYDHFRERFLREPVAPPTHAWLPNLLGRLWPFRRRAAA
jgi:hypothetical protein